MQPNSSDRVAAKGRLRLSDRCHVCGYKQDLRRDGTLGKHHWWIGGEYVGVCAGTGLTIEESRREFERRYGGVDA